MGICSHCEKEITLNADEKICPNCGKYPYYCWNCDSQIDSSNIKECPVCHFFKCSKCGSCGTSCTLNDMIVILKEIIPNETEEKIFMIIKRIKEFLEGKIHKSCNQRDVPISYAKNKLRNAAIKILGYNSKNEIDKIEYQKRFDEIKEYKIGYTWTINQVRENGNYGNEYRDISNMAVCMGIAKIKKEIITKALKKIEIIHYERIDGQKCDYVNWDKLLIKKCKRCKTIYYDNRERCNCVYSKGSKKGENPVLEETLSTVNFCQLKRKDFIKKGVNDGDDSRPV